MKNERFLQNGGGASLLARFNKGLGELLPSPLEGEGRISTQGTSVRNSGEGWWCQRHDNIFGFGLFINVIPHLLRDLKQKIRSRNRSWMTLVSCHCEGERSEAVAIAKSLELNEITTSCATPRNDKLVSEAHGKELNVLTSYRLNDFKKKAGATHVDMSDNIRRVAFTLAEVLITLAIIGIVAAMTIPTLISNYKKKEYSTKLKKFYSLMSQAVKLSEIENGSAIYWNKEEMAVDENEEPIVGEQKDRALRFYNKYIAKYIKADIAENEEEAYKLNIKLSDGSVFEFHNGQCMDLDYDLNGNKSPNVYGQDKFIFLLCTSVSPEHYHPLTPNSAFSSYTQYDSIKHEKLDTREKALNKCAENGKYCSVLLLLYDNFEFKEDYPYKL